MKRFCGFPIHKINPNKSVVLKVGEDMKIQVAKKILTHFYDCPHLIFSISFPKKNLVTISVWDYERFVTDEPTETGN